MGDSQLLLGDLLKVIGWIKEMALPIENETTVTLSADKLGW